MSSLDAGQLAWAQTLIKDAPAAKKAAAIIAARSKVLGEVTAELDGKLDEIKAGQMYELEQVNTGLTGKLYDLVGHKKRIRSHDPGRDPNKEVDTGHYKMEGMQELPPGQVARVMAAQKIIADLTAKLREARSEDGDALFSDIEIGNEVWANLVRQGIVPENAVPDEFSDVKRTFDAASAAYQDRLASYTDELEDNATLLSRLGVADSVIKGLGSTAKATAKVVAEFVPNMPLKEVTSIVELIQVAGTSVVAVTKQAASTRDPAEILSSIGDMAVQAVLAGFIGQGKDLDTIKSAVSSSVKAGFGSAKGIAHLAKGETDKAMEAFAEAVGSVIGAGDSDELKTAAPLVSSGLKALLKAPKFIKLGQARRFDELADEMMTATVQVFSEVGKQALSHYYKEANPDGLDDAELDDQIDEQSDELGEAMEAAKDAPDLVVLVTTGDPAKVERILGKDEEVDQKAAARLQRAVERLGDKDRKKFEAVIARRNAAVAKVAQARSDAEARAFTNALASGDMGPSKDQDSVETMILEIKRRQKTLELAIKLAKLPFEVVGAFFPPAKMGASLIALAAEMAATVKCIDAYLKWRDNTADAKAAASVQAEAMVNRAGLSSTQALRHGAQAALETIRVIGQGLQLGAHMTAHVGVALEAAATVGSTAKEIIIKIEDKAKMELAWRAYRDALANPADRLQMRKTLRKNATMAKYAIAYGALYEKDPVAKNAMRKCGLNEEVLTERGTNVDAVVKYMETLYSEDMVVLKAVARPQKWHPKGDASLTVDSWLGYVQGAKTKADPPLAATTQIGGVNSAFALLAAAKVEYDAAPTPEERTVQSVDEMVKYNTLLLKVLGSLSPLTAAGAKHEQFAEYVDLLNALVGAEIIRLEKEKKLLPDPEDGLGTMFDDAEDGPQKRAA